MRILGAVALLAIVGSVACEGGEQCVSYTDCPDELAYELRCQIGDRDCQAAIYESVSELMRRSGPVPDVRTISPEDFAEEVWADVTADGPVEQETDNTRALRAIGFLRPEASSLGEEQINRFIESTAAYYSREDKSVTVIDRDYGLINAQMILAHEFAHAIQDGDGLLDAMYADIDGNDGFLAAASVVEGDAQHWSHTWVGYLGGPAPGDWSWVEGADQAIVDPEQTLINAARRFPYGHGFRFMSTAFTLNGIEGRGEVIAEPPTTSLTVLEGYSRYVQLGEKRGLFNPDTAFEIPPGGWSELDTSSYGAWYLYGFLARLEPGNVAGGVALSWRGDRMSAYGKDDNVVAVWRIRFDVPEPGIEVARIVNAGSAPYSWAAFAEGDEVFIVAAETSEVLAEWLEAPLAPAVGERRVAAGRGALSKPLFRGVLPQLR